MEKTLKFWLNMDAWSIDEATQIIAGINPDKTIKPHIHPKYGHRIGELTLLSGRQIPTPPPEPSYRLVGGELFESLELIQEEFKESAEDLAQENRDIENMQLEAYFKKCSNIARLFNNPSTLPISPQEWIERSLSKHIEIHWLKFAIDCNLLPIGLKGKIQFLAEDGLIRLVDMQTTKDTIETPQEYRARLRARVKAEKAKGTKAFNKVVAEEERISRTRLKQLLKDDKNVVEKASNNWTGLVAVKTRQPVSK